jgi:hypothetical protein
MGLSWSQPKTVASKTSIMYRASFPTNPILKSRLWSLWKLHKDSLKADGFSVKLWNKVWYVSHFHTIIPTSYNQTPPTNEPFYAVEFRRLYAKWNAEYEMMPAVVEPEPAADEFDSPWFIQEDE